MHVLMANSGTIVNMCLPSPKSKELVKKKQQPHINFLQNKYDIWDSSTAVSLLIQYILDKGPERVMAANFIMFVIFLFNFSGYILQPYLSKWHTFMSVHLIISLYNHWHTFWVLGCRFSDSVSLTVYNLSCL